MEIAQAVMPEELQATIMNIFRIPLNILVVIEPDWIRLQQLPGIFSLCFVAVDGLLLRFQVMLD